MTILETKYNERAPSYDLTIFYYKSDNLISYELKISISNELVEFQKRIRQKFNTAKLRYGELILRRKFRTAKFPYGEISLRRNFLTAKFPSAH